MKREIATKRSNIDNTKRLTFIKNSPSSLQSSSSSSISNAEASKLAADSSRTVKPGNTTKPSPSHIPSINPSKVVAKEKNDCTSTAKKASNQSKIALKLQPGTRLKSGVENKFKLLKKQQEEGNCDECGDATQETNQGKFTSPWVLSGDGANMKSKNFKKATQNGMHSKLPTKLYSTKLNRSRSNLSGCKSPHLRSTLSRRSISRSHSKLSGSRKNLVPPAPPVRTVSLKNNPRPMAQSGKQKSAPGVAGKKSNSSANIEKPGNELTDKSCSRMQGSSDKKSLSSLEAPKIRQKLENHRNERKRYSEEIEVNLNYVNLFTNHSSTADKKDAPNDFRNLDFDLQSKHQPITFEAPNTKVNDFDELSDRKSFDVSWDSLGRRLGSKFNYVVKKTGITDRRDSKAGTNEYVTMETIRKLKNNLNVQQSHHNSPSLQSNNNSTNQQKFQGISRLNSEPGHKVSITPNPSGHFMRSRLGSVPTLPSNLPMNFSVVSDSTLPNNHPFKQNGNLCKRSMSDVGGSPVQRSSSSNLNVPRDSGRLQSYSSQSLRLSQNSAFSPLFNPVEQDLARLRSFSASQNRTLNRLHLLPFQDHHFAPSRHKNYRLSHSSLLSDRSIRSCSSSFLVPLGRSTKEVQELQKELEHAQSRINNLTSQLTSNVQVVASFEQNLEKMLKRLQNMNTKESEASELKNLLQKINDHHHHHHHRSENTCGRISKSCEDLLDSKRNESPQTKKERKKNWLMNSLSKAFLRNRNKTNMDVEVFNIQHFSHETLKEQAFAGRESHVDVFEEFSKVKPPDHIDSLQLNIRTKSGKAEITVKQYANKNQVYSLYVVIKKDQGLADEKNLYKILAGNIEITKKMSWQDLDSKVQSCFEEHLKKLDENSLDLSRESIFNYNVGGLWRNIGDVNPEFLPCGYLVGACDSVFLHLKGLNEKCLDALSYETLHRKNSLKKLCKMTSEHGRLLVINRPDNNDSCLLKKIAHFSIKLSNSTEVIDIRGKQSMEVIESFANKLNSNKSSRNELKLLILKNVDKFILDDENKMNYALLGNVLFQEPKLRIIGEAEAMKDSIFEFLSNFHCWVWPDEFRNFLKRHLRRKFLLENQLSHHSNKFDENPNVLTQWICSFIDKFSDLGLPGSKKDLKQLLSCPLDTNSAQLWFGSYWRLDLFPRYFSSQSKCSKLTSFAEWVESSWLLKSSK